MQDLQLHFTINFHYPIRLDLKVSRSLTLKTNKKTNKTWWAQLEDMNFDNPAEWHRPSSL